MRRLTKHATRKVEAWVLNLWVSFILVLDLFPSVSLVVFSTHGAGANVFSFSVCLASRLDFSALIKVSSCLTSMVMSMITIHHESHHVWLTL